MDPDINSCPAIQVSLQENKNYSQGIHGAPPTPHTASSCDAFDHQHTAWRSAAYCPAFCANGDRRGSEQSTEASLHAFENVQQERELQLSRTAALLAELPTLKAMMPLEHAPTIQDASEPFWKLAGSQLFVLGGPDGQVYGFHVSKQGWDAHLAEADLKKSIEHGEDAAWWYGNGQLYRVFLRTILTGSEKDQRQVGIIAVGYQIDSDVAAQLALASGSQIALATDDKIIATTLPAAEEKELQSEIQRGWDVGRGSREMQLGASHTSRRSCCCIRASLPM